MNLLVRSWPRTASRTASRTAVVLLAWGMATAALGQTTTCPITAACLPGRASNGQAAAYGMGILNVTIGNSLIDKTSPGQADGYQDYSCTQNAALVVGQSYPISIRTNGKTPENVRVWIDYNNDGAFTGNDELVFSSDNNTLHTGTITPPATAVLATRLRLRVAADFANGVVPTSCSTPEYSQDEDYSVTLTANSSPPVAAFNASAAITCTGCVQFTDASQNLPTAWLWTFGDGNTSPDQSPSHCYTTAGTYAVTLKTTNSAGTSTSAATNIVYNTTVPVAASCSPATLNYFANYGITHIRLNTIDKASADGSAGYQDFTCTERTELIANVSYALIITTGGVNPHDIRVYLDKDNDGILTTSEQIFQSLNTPTPGTTTSFVLPTGTVLNKPLRLRVVADAVGNAGGPCASPVSGQVEDYTVVARPNTLPPAINFKTDYIAGGCVNPVQFTDLTTNLPTAWLWSFGDGSTSTLQNPSHKYAATGTYNVSLSATNTNGTASITRLNAVSISVPCQNYCASNGTGGTGGVTGGQQPSQFYITSVSVANAQPAFTNTSGNSPAGYTNYTTRPITVAPGSTVSISVVSNLSIVHRVAIWVDLNSDGSFDYTELLINDITPSGAGAATLTASFKAPITTGVSRMRILSVANSNYPYACAINQLNAEVEDYQLRVQPLATREALALPALSLYPTPTPDGHLHLRLTDAAAAGLYATEVQNLLGATILRTSLRLAPAADAELDLSALAPGIYVLRLRGANGQTALRRVVRE